MPTSTALPDPLCYWAIVPAAGIGSRMGAEYPKQYLPLAGRAVIEHTLERLAQHPLITEIVVALAEDDEYWAEINLLKIPKPVTTTIGGKERCDSVLNGLRAIESRANDKDWVLVHDAARPCVRVADIEQLISQCKNSDGGLLGIAAKDTMKLVDDEAYVTQTLNREFIWQAFTPQMFRYRNLRDALEQGLRLEKPITDEAMAMELAGYRPKLISAHADNIKITRPEDLALAEFYQQQQLEDDTNTTGNSKQDGN
ncbi:2-C-methyl-D-erythritol 4-phosphate cytidylyltransferase [hydrothermal vent metagenome]|uniref:2-C-methyl-D-erythritol 4-phosphate cytidylyltransferase n=1 Tax=hydrothermal vent metagenome TaxID=652676 RepID=A0A3B1AHB2_9ZZZZ